MLNPTRSGRVFFQDRAGLRGFDTVNRLDQIHGLVKSDMNIGTLKGQVEKFFDFHKYGKMMRKLRY